MRMPRRPFWLWRIGAIVLLSGCASLPHPTVADAQRAHSRWPEVTLTSLESGRAAYAARCSSCHRLYSPQSRTPDQWAKEVAEMTGRSHLLLGEQELIERFLATMSAQKE